MTEANGYLLSVDTGVVRIGSNSLGRAAPAELLSRTDPEYSEEARLAELEGTVVVTADSDGEGRARNLRIGRTLGLGLDEKAVQAVQQWRFMPGTESARAAVDFSLHSKGSRWHLIGVSFQPPQGVSRPVVLRSYYPSGAGVFGGAAIEQDRLLGAIGRQSFVELSFDVNELGIPTNIQIERSSETVWNDQAIAVARAWRFAPGVKDGRPVSVSCTVDLAWGPRNLGSREVEQLVQALQNRWTR